MFRSLIQETSAPNLGRHRSLIEALFGVKNDHSSESIDTDEGMHSYLCSYKKLFDFFFKSKVLGIFWKNPGY